MKKRYFKLFSSNILVWGAAHSAIYDLQNHAVHSVPNVLHDVIRTLENKSLEEYKASHSIEVFDLVYKYLTGLIAKNLGFFCAAPQRYPAMDLSWHCSSLIETVVIEYNRSTYAIEGLALQLNTLLCKYLEIRMPADCSINDFNMLYNFENSTLRSINLVLYQQSNFDITFLSGCFLKFKKLKTIIVYNAATNFKVEVNNNESIYFFSSLHPDVADNNSPKPMQHIVNKQFFMESLVYNPFYNRRIAIDRGGSIKNDLKHKTSFGHVDHCVLTDLLTNSAIKVLWGASVDKIKSYQQSAFRYAMFITEELVEEENGCFSIVKQPLLQV